MSQKFYTLITTQGAALLANATALGIPLKLTKMAVGDANGSESHPTATQTKLIHEVYRAPINTITTDKDNPNQIIAELVIPETQGGWFINEIGLYDDGDNLIAVGNCPVTYKPKLVEGSGRTQVIRMIIIVDNVDSVQLKIDPAVVLATRKYVDDLIATKMADHEKSTNHPDATIKSKGFVQLNSATNSTAENQAATPLAIKTTYDLAAGAVKKTGDVINGQITFEYQANGIKFNYENPDWTTVIRPAGDNFSFNFYDAKEKKSFTKFRYTNGGNAWRFENIDDVTINGKSILKTGDYGIGAPTGTSVQNLDEHLNSGFYGTNTAKLSNPPFAAGAAASLVVLPSDSPHWKVEQLSVINGRTPKIYYRTDTKNDGKQAWYEAITTANVGEYTHPFKGDLANKSLNDLTGTDAGNYFQGRNTSASISGNNYPIGEAGDLVVKKNGADGLGCSQIYTTYRNARQFIRNYRGGTKTWEPWIEQITTANANQILPVGIPQPWPKNTLPTGWLECNGSVFDKNQYPKLAIAYPSGYLPDLRGEFIRGWDNGRGIDPGRNILYWQAQQVAAHRHVGGLGENSMTSEQWRRERIAPFGSTNDRGIWGGVFNSDLDNPLFYTNDGTNGGITIQTATTCWDDLNPVGLVGNETRPRNIAFMYIVKAE